MGTYLCDTGLGHSRSPLHSGLCKTTVGNWSTVMTTRFVTRRLRRCSKPPIQRHSGGVMELISMIKVYDWINSMSVDTAYIEPGSPSQNGCCERFNARPRDKVLNGEISYSLRDAQIQIERWWQHYNAVRPHRAIGYRPPAPESVITVDQNPTMN